MSLLTEAGAHEAPEEQHMGHVLSISCIIDTPPDATRVRVVSRAGAAEGLGAREYIGEHDRCPSIRGIKGLSL